MARDPNLHQQFIERVKAFYKSLDDQKEYGVKKFTTAYCVAKTAEHYLLKPKTIENYIYS